MRARKRATSGKSSSSSRPCASGTRAESAPPTPTPCAPWLSPKPLTAPCSPARSSESPIPVADHVPGCIPYRSARLAALRSFPVPGDAPDRKPGKCPGRRRSGLPSALGRCTGLQRGAHDRAGTALAPGPRLSAPGVDCRRRPLLRRHRSDHRSVGGGRSPAASAAG